MVSRISSGRYPVVIITVYNRAEHIRNCLESLEQCEDSKKFHVIVGSDAPFIPEHKDEVGRVRNYLANKKRENGFLKLSTIYHKENVGEIENTDTCHRKAKAFGYNSFIFMEDDVVVGLYFLKFMRSALIAYADYPDIVAVNGYVEHDLKLTPVSPFLYNRFTAYGFGSWYHKWDLLEEKRVLINYAKKMLSNTKRFREVVGFTDFPKSYPFLAERFYWAGDIEIGLMMEFEELWVLKPPVSLTANRGMDGTGLRSGTNAELQLRVASDHPVEILPFEQLQRFKFQDLRPKIDFKSILVNWAVFGIYRYLPFGFRLLVKLRSLKKSL